ncbi:MAG: hypothetical protein ABMB14_26830, partial [Myxococcota bacterium]
YVEDQEAAAERIGWHLLHAGEIEQAIGSLLLGVVHRRDTAGARSALGLLATADDALGRLSLPATDPRWAEAWQLRAMLCAELGEVNEAERWAEKVLDSEQVPGWAPHALDCRLTLARLQASRGELTDADAQFDRILQQSTDPVQQGLAHAERALVAARRRDRDGARAHTDQAVRLLRRAAYVEDQEAAAERIGWHLLHARNERQAEDALARGLRLYRLRGNLIGQAECLAGLGRAATLRGDAELAEERLRQAIHLYEVAGNSDVVKPKADLARLRVEAGRYDEARDLLGNLRLQLSRQGRVGVVQGLGAMQLASAAGCVDWEEFEHRLGQVEADPGTEVGDDGRWALELAVKLANAAGDLSRATRVRSLSEDLRTGRL